MKEHGSPRWALVQADGFGSGLKRRIVVKIDDEDVDAVELNLGSPRSRDAQAKKWAERFQIPEAEIIEKLARAAAMATKVSQKTSKPRNEDKPSFPPRTLDEIRPEFDRWLDHLDRDILDIVFGATIAHRIEGDPVWLFIIGSPGDGKTEVLRALSQHDSTYCISTLTPGALISGYKTEDSSDPSLIPKLHGKVLHIKDFTAVLELPKEARAEIMGILRDAYDGECTKVFGNGLIKRYTSRFGLVAAVTPVIDSHWSVAAQLGERFIRLRLPCVDGRRSKIHKALRNTNDEVAMREQLSYASGCVLSQEFIIPNVDPDIEARLVPLADFVSRARSAVTRNHKMVVQFVPQPEVGTRVGKALKKLGLGIAMARREPRVGEDIYRVIKRVAIDTLPSMRARLLTVLWNNRNFYVSTQVLANQGELATETARTWLDDLRLLGMVDRGGKPGGTGYTWCLDNDFRQTIIDAGMSGGDFAPQADGEESEQARGAKAPPTNSLYEETEFGFGESTQ